MADKGRGSLARQVRAAGREHERLVKENDGDPTGHHSVVLDTDDVTREAVIITANAAGWDWLAGVLDAAAEED